ncbi:hypothetical protein IMZ48_45015 [Candidatus Bathyarchaeota archaeon]|nr:hypothetical protein [Candidatus Bathyarchaeota archaeon]
MVRAIFKKVVLATAGPLPGHFTVENITNWVQLRKGTFSSELDASVTHVLCTEELLKERGPRGMTLLPPPSSFRASTTFLALPSIGG